MLPRLAERQPLKSWPQLAEEIAHAVRAHSAMLNGEICCLDADGRSNFNNLLFRREWPFFALSTCSRSMARTSTSLSVVERRLHLRAITPNVESRLRFLDGRMRGNYVAAAGMALRREVDRQYTANMRHLLFEIEKRPTVVSRERYYAGWPLRHEVDGMLRERSFNQFGFVSPDGDSLHDHIDPLSVREDREELVLQTEIVQDYIEQTIAHRGGGQNVVPVSFKDFNAAIDAVVPIFKKYYALLTLSSVAQVEPVPQYNTHDVFTFPWDKTCCEMWLEFMKDKRLDWSAIRTCIVATRRRASVNNDRAGTNVIVFCDIRIWRRTSSRPAEHSVHVLLFPAPPELQDVKPEEVDLFHPAVEQFITILAEAVFEEWQERHVTGEHASEEAA